MTDLGDPPVLRGADSMLPKLRRGFWIVPAGLDAQATTFDRNAALVESAPDYVAGKTPRDSSGHIVYHLAVAFAVELSGAINGFMSQTGQVLTGVAGELRSVAEEAKGIDMQTLADLDAQDPADYDGPPSPFEHLLPKPWSPFLDPSKGFLAPPDRRLDEPFRGPLTTRGGGVAFYCDPGPGYLVVPRDDASWLPDDLTEPSEWLLAVLRYAGVPDLKDQLMAIVGGDWPAMNTYVYVIGGLGRMLQDVHDQVRTATKEALAVDWQGDAAASAQTYFDSLLSALQRQSDAFDRAGDGLQDYMRGVDTFFSELESAVKSAIGSAMKAIGAAQTTGAFAGKGPGTFVSIITAILTVESFSDVMDALAKVKGLMDKAESMKVMGEGIDGLVDTLRTATSDLRAPAMQEY